MNHLTLIFVFVLAATVSCVQTKTPAPSPAGKVELDLNALDADGLRGPTDGKTSVAYEFVIPDTTACREQVLEIDPTVQFHPGSRGRIGAAPDQVLCIGETHQPNFTEVLHQLAALPFIERIVPCYFE